MPTTGSYSASYTANDTILSLALAVIPYLTSDWQGVLDVREVTILSAVVPSTRDGLL